MQWSDILSEIKRSLKEPETDGHWSDSEYLRRANIIQRRVCRESECIVETNIDTLSVAGTSLYNKPDKCLKILAVYYGNTKLYEIEKTTLDLGEMEGNLQSPWQDVSGTPTNFYQTRTSIGVYPKPNNDNDVITIVMVIQADDLVEATDEPFNGVFDLEDAYELIVNGVLWKCLLEDQKDIYSEYKNEFLAEIIKLRRQMKSKQNVMQSFGLIGKTYGYNTNPLPILGD